MGDLTLWDLEIDRGRLDGLSRAFWDAVLDSLNRMSEADRAKASPRSCPYRSATAVATSSFVCQARDFEQLAEVGRLPRSRGTLGNPRGRLSRVKTARS